MAKFLRVKQMQNREIKSELRQSRAYRNPSFLQKMVEHSDIKEFGSNLPAEVFDPDNLHEEVTPLCFHCNSLKVRRDGHWLVLSQIRNVILTASCAGLSTVVAHTVLS